jgi:hypothetical protein
MNPKYLGDSYDIVKHCLLRWLGALGPWTAHPMFTEAVSDQQAAAFSALLGVPLISTDVLAQGADRDAYFASARSCASHLFLDPDTGVRMKSTRGKKAPAYVFLEELVRIASRQQGVLTLVFDQSVQRGAEANGLTTKLIALARKGLHSFAYRSHACFLVVGPGRELVAVARNVLDRKAHLPKDRFVTRPAA